MSAPSAPRALDSLPPVPPEFTGREQETDALLALLNPDAVASTPSAAVVSGLPGVGKTTVAVAAGRRAQDNGWFAGTQFIDLRGYDQSPTEPAQALDALLRSLGVEPAYIPPTLEERQALYRSRLAALAAEGHRLLIVADNASAPGQISPLLPGTPHHRVLVASRHTLTGLGDRIVQLRALEPEAAVDLLRQALHVADPEDRRIEEEPEAALALAAACGYLPLALHIAAALLIGAPGQAMAERAAQLTSMDSNRLVGLDDGARTVRSVFDQLLHRLPPQQADLFRLLSLNPGPSISTKAASLLADRTEHETRMLLDALVRAHLIEPADVRDRWQMHDLLRDYAAEQAKAHAERGRDIRRRYAQARDRLMRYYVRRAGAGAKSLKIYGAGGEPADLEGALKWFDAERPTLIAAVHAGRATNGCRAAGLALDLGRYLNLRLRHDEFRSVSAVAHDIYRDLRMPLGQGSALVLLSIALNELRRHDEALEAAREAHDICAGIGDREGQADALTTASNAWKELRRHDQALKTAQRAHDIHQDIGDHRGRAISLHSLSIIFSELGRYAEALDAARDAHQLVKGHTDPQGQGIVQYDIGVALQGQGRLDEAEKYVASASRILTELNDAFRTGMAYRRLAQIRAAAGADRDQVVAAWHQAATAYAKAGAEPEAEAARQSADEAARG
ncbi:tetratricopeptide repeat protein [Streptomyces sp. DSM 44917]|uniref:Tetratricopeptide repeat protein n=1 Tax=Streptomyces boetiae TaxID=3075541 RepID=A0ABU2LB96_9ACTN|nr:tetratricopeptide repeat protein [Streptomyces sp. DSM 44917]MDT0308853.1 tetratricopeptide repeat protein [Streptomyces sp. DSM 44917]